MEQNDSEKDGGSTSGKIRKLQKTYNKILVDLFDQYAAESIEEALEQSEGTFGENIQDIVQCALDCLRDKVHKELGIESVKADAIVTVGKGAGLDYGIMDGMYSGSEEEDLEDPEHEAGETEEEEAKERLTGIEDEDKM